MSDEFLFSGLKVLDMGSWIAAPVASTILSDFGAQVIKVEAPEIGDGYRAFATMASTPSHHENYTWEMDNHNKRSITLNLKSEQGREILRELVKESDIYITNLPHPMRRQWSLSYQDLAAVNPKMIYASLTAYGEYGPERDREGFDLVAYWSRSGLMDLVRSPEAPPAPALPGMGDHPTSITLYASILTALFKRQQTGKGSHVHTSLLANGIWSASCIAQGAFAGADFDDYYESQSKLFARRLYEAADGRWLQFSMVRTDEEVDLMFAAMERPDLLLDPRFATSDARLENGARLASEIVEIIGTKTSTDWMTVFHAMGVPSALVGQVGDLPDDPQIKANNMAFKPVDGVDMPLVIKHPLNIEGLDTQAMVKAPTMGEHTAEILKEIGYSRDQIEALQNQGVV
jgi:formyl-CoA transferase